MNVTECAEWLKSRDNFLLVTHTNPDGDTLCSAAALCAALRRCGKTAYLFRNPQITPKYGRYVGDFISDDFAYDHVIAVDCADKKRICGLDGEVDLCIDHHPTNEHYSKELLLKGEKAACGEIVLEVIKCLCGSVTPEEASLLYVAVSTDCGCFRYANVTTETFAAASELTGYGAEIQKLNYELFRQISRARMVLEGLICAGLDFYEDGKLVVAAVTKEMLKIAEATEDDTDDIAGIPGKVEGCVVSVVIKELDNGDSKVSVRSQPCFDSSAVCAKFNGGGHKMAAGCTVKAGVEETKKLLVEAVCEQWAQAE